MGVCFFRALLQVHVRVGSVGVVWAFEDALSAAFLTEDVTCNFSWS